MKQFFKTIWIYIRAFGAYLNRLLLPVARRIGMVQTYILLFIIYFTVLFLTSFFVKLFGVDLLKKRFHKKKLQKIATLWQPKEPIEPTLERSLRQF